MLPEHPEHIINALCLERFTFERGKLLYADFLPDFFKSSIC